MEEGHLGKQCEQGAAFPEAHRRRPPDGKVADRLGDDHDLAMLEAKLAALPARSKAQRKLLARIEARRAKLQKTALKLARRMYRRKAAAFVDRVLAG